MISVVTGASGTIGRRIVNMLMAQGHIVRVLARGEYSNPEVQIYKGDLSDELVLEELVSGADMVFHCAAETRDPSRMREVNVFGTERIVRVIRRHPIKYFCYLSSAGVVGSIAEAWIDESAPCNPTNLYETTKCEAEFVAVRKIEGCTTIILRPTNVVDVNHLAALSLPINGSLSSKIKAFLKGGECAHIVHVDDVAAAAVYFSGQISPDPRVFFVSLDHDPLNTVANLWSLYQSMANDQEEGAVGPLPHLPALVPHIMRRMAGKKSNIGNIRYSSGRLISAGFKFSFGVKDTVRRIAFDRSRNLSRAVVERRT